MIRRTLTVAAATVVLALAADSRALPRMISDALLDGNTRCAAVLGPFFPTLIPYRYEFEMELTRSVAQVVRHQPKYVARKVNDVIVCGDEFVWLEHPNVPRPPRPVFSSLIQYRYEFTRQLVAEAEDFVRGGAMD